MEVTEGELLPPSPGTLFDHPNCIGSGNEGAPIPELSKEEEKREIGPVDSSEVKDEEEDEASSIETSIVSEGGGRTGGQYTDRSGDQLSDGSPRNQKEERTKKSLFSRNDEGIQEESRRQVDSYRAIDRSGPVRGPVRDRSSDRSPLFPSYNEGESKEKECSRNQKYDQLEKEIRRQVDSYRAIDRTGPGTGP